MGIDVHGLNLLNYARTRRSLGRTVTIGRQGLHAPQHIVRNMLNLPKDYEQQAYCEQLLIGQLGAESVDSIDNSNYEDATIVHDMNVPLPNEQRQKFDTVIDGGCLEHIYNVTIALSNCSQLCRPGGQIIHILPANNFCGHGFWQFSPELFFSLYSQKNGYRDTEVFLADLEDIHTWYKVRPPSNGERVNVYGMNELYALVRTEIVGPDFHHENVQQSDYVFEWDRAATVQGTAVQSKDKWKARLKSSPLLYSFVANNYRRYRRWLLSRLNGRNPGLDVLPIKSLRQFNSR